MLKYPNLFSQITLAGTVFRNRLFASPTGTAYMTSQHFPVPETNAYYERKAIGGAASVCVGDAVICSKHGRFNYGHLVLDNPAGLPAMTRLSEAITRHGAVAAIELSHSGSNARSSAADGNKIYGPMEYTTKDGFNAEAMTEEKIYEVVQQYADAASWAKRCGFGMVTIHGGHGWLLTEFMSPFLNRRTDRWGGGVENRCRFAVEVCKAIRKAVGPKFPIEIRISGSECNPNGYDLDEGIAIAKQLDGHVDLIHVSAGSHEVWEVFTVTHPDMFLPEGVNVQYAAEIKKHVAIPVATVGALIDPEHMEHIIASGQADVIQVARGLIADPDLPLKARLGRAGEINKCMRCMTCFSNHILQGQFLCPINPHVGHELSCEASLPAVKKKVLVAGGGAGGMQAAITAAKRGHEVILCEKTDKLGGVLNCEHDVPFKRNLTEYLLRQAAQAVSAGVDVRLNTEVTPELAKSLSPDVIIAALGARPLIPDIPGIENGNVYSAEEMYYNAPKAGKKVVILGGGLVGTELAIYLAGLNHEVTIAEMSPQLDDGGNMLQGLATRLELGRRGVTVSLSTKAVGISSDGVMVESSDGKLITLAADTVVYATGQIPLRKESAALNSLAPEFHQIGDCLVPNNITEATRPAFHIANDIGRL